MQRKEVFRFCDIITLQLYLREVDPLSTAATLQTLLSACVFDKSLSE